MSNIYFFGYHLNGLEYVTFIILPTSIILILLVFIYFNLRILRTSIKLSNEDKYKVLDYLYNEDYLKTPKK